MLSWTVGRSVVVCAPLTTLDIAGTTVRTNKQQLNGKNRVMGAFSLIAASNDL
jgi:hypothetical protein